MKAVICAAGMGSRLAPLTIECPKPLLFVGKKRPLEYLLDNLSACGVTDVIIVVGHMADFVQKTIGTEWGACKITYIENKDYMKTNNIYSLWLAKPYITDGMIFFNADIIFNVGVLRSVLESPFPDCVATDLAAELVDDAMKVHVENGAVTHIGKKIAAEPHGWAIGIYRLSQATSKRYFSEAEALFAQDQKHVPFVVPLQKMVEDVTINIAPIHDQWVEIDTHEDYAIAKERVSDIVSIRTLQ